MALLIYITVAMTLCMISFFPDRIKHNKSISSAVKVSTDFNLEVPWIRIILITLILSIYSKYIGLTGELADRTNYIFSFYYRYPFYSNSWDTLISARTEPGIVLISNALAKITTEANWLFFVATFLFSIINLYVISRITRNRTAVIAFMLLSLFFFQSTYLIKQSLAIAFANLAILQYLNRRPLRYVLYATMACIFHMTALIMLPLYFAFRMSKSKASYVLVSVIFLIFFVYYGPIINEMIQSIPIFTQYIAIGNYTYTFGGGSTVSFVKGIPFYLLTFLALRFRTELKREIPSADVFILSSVIYSMSWILTYNMYWSFRIGWYCMLTTLILIPPLFKIMKENKAYLYLGVIAVLGMILITLRQIAITLY